MARPNWEYIRIDVLLPEHPKTDGLSDKAFRTLVELWCWCGLNRTDGFVRDAKWQAFGNKAARDQLLRVPPGCKHGFAERVDGGYLMHDYVGPDGHQRSRAEIDELSERRARAGRKGAASRWRALASAMARAIPSAMASRWQPVWQSDGKPMATGMASRWQRQRQYKPLPYGRTGASICKQTGLINVLI